MKRLFAVLFCFIFFSCTTNTVFVPGEKQVKTKNLYAEYYNLAEEYVKLKNYSKAIEFYKTAMNDKSLHDAAYYKVGRCYALDKQYSKAREVFENILKKDPENLALRSSVAYLYAMSGDTKKACLLYKNLVLEKPDDKDLLVNYTSVLMAAKDFEAAKLNLDFLEKKFPDAGELKSLKEAYERNTDSSVQN
ncbi:tetratricopeptide repeat protein [Treponema sp.]|uniref:tetratricopeptide repeat protein n=1 Tax=Treponema sp. TaxID=166 RepID=UPI00298DC4AC|nr:tetratricopeptide repeat protein [Treponema sp.]MCR5612473.1 tetratricopeptide repeat protein [Treponema sp.]